MRTNGGNVMEINYKRDHSYSADDVKELFLSVDWLSGKYPERLKKALDNCETVITAWVSGRLVGLINVLDDGELTAYIHYLCVNPKYQGFGIVKTNKRKVQGLFIYYCDCRK